jgi:hypothetical protein
MGAKEPNKPEPQAARAKQLEKIKPEKEHKLEIKEKIEWKEHKLEWKEHKLEWKEHKNELKEFKAEWKEHKPEIIEGGKLIFEGDPKGPVEGGPIGGGLVDPVQNRDALLAHADALVKQGEELRHFIESSDRPDVGEGALKNEPDQ